MVLDRHQEDLYLRPSWLDAAVALQQIEKGKAEGRVRALWFRSLVHEQFFQLGYLIRRSALLILLLALILLGLCCVGLKSTIFHTRIDQLWIEEGGRLANDLKYIESVLEEQLDTGTHQLVISTPKDPEASLLHADGLLALQKALKVALGVTVHVYNVPWKLKDICSTPGFTSFESQYIDQIFRQIIPCVVVSALDCFWEGSKLLGPDAPVTVPEIPYKLKWTNLNPESLVQTAKSVGTYFPIQRLEDIMKRAGITTGYQEKPCLNPRDKECPNTAPNKNSSHRLDIGAILTGGCYGFAAKYMHWSEGSIVGGIKRNKTGHITKAHALLANVQLMGEKELFEYYKDDYKVQQIYWSPQKASLVLQSWQRKFSEEINKQMKLSNDDTLHYNIYPFSTVLLNDILSHFSEVNLKNIFIGYLIMLIFVGLVLFKYSNPILSQTAVGIAGVLIISLANAAGLGICAVVGIPFNTSTIHVMPYLGLSIGVLDLFLLMSAYARQSPTDTQSRDPTGVMLRKGGLIVLLQSACLVSAFLAAAYNIPIPSLRAFSLQAAILVVFNLVISLIVIPTIIKIDLSRRNSGRVDIFCFCCVMPGDGNWPCLEGSPEIQRKSHKHVCDSKKRQAVTCALPPDRSQTVTVLAASDMRNKEENPGLLKSLLSNEVLEFGSPPMELDQQCSSEHFLEHYTKFLSKKLIKTLTVIAFFIIMIASTWNITKLTYGLDLSDIVPRGTNEHSFLKAQEKYFGYYTMFAVTKDNFEYPTNQQLLYEYHNAFTRVPQIVKNSNGGLPKFWLSMFRDWLVGLQKAFDRDWMLGSITQEHWSPNASEDGILAYKLMVQTGYAEKPVDKSLVPQTRLVNEDGIINPDAFYNYLSAWVCNDALAYSASQGNLKPEPKQWCYVANDYQLEIPKALPLIYSQIPFEVQGLTNTTQFTAMISQVRDLCTKYEASGLPNFMIGIPFFFWEHYLELGWEMMTGVLCALGLLFCVVALLFLNLWAATLVTVNVTFMIVQILGAFSLMGIQLNAISAVLVIVAVGIDAFYVVHTCLSFLTAIGNRERRLELALKHMSPVIGRGALGMILAFAMLFISDFDFIVSYFFRMLTIINIIGIVNGGFFFPVFLLLFGPPAEVKPLDYPDRIGTPSPQPTRKSRKSSSQRGASAPSMRRQRNPSLSTITEEPGSWDSATHEIVVEPELIVETTTFTQPHSQAAPTATASSYSNLSGNENESSCNSSPIIGHRMTKNLSSSSLASSTSGTSSASGHVTTKVTATAKFKVEVHTPIHGACERSNSCHRYSSRRRDSTSSTSTTSTDCSMKH